jgi:hypothetical protein
LFLDDKELAELCEGSRIGDEMSVRSLSLLVVTAVALAALDAVATLAADISPMSPTDISAALASPDVAAGRATISDPKRDAETFASFAKAAKAGNAIAETYLGYLYYMGHGVQQNDRIAAYWLRRAAERGFADAQLRLAIMYLSGRELPNADRSLARDAKEGMVWMRRAADGGIPMVLDMVADELQAPFSRRLTDYIQGRTTAEEAKATDEETAGLHKAVELYRRAAQQNDRYAIQTLCSLRAFLVPMPPEMPKWCELAAQPPSNWSMASSAVYVGGVDPAVLSSDKIPMTEP